MPSAAPVVDLRSAPHAGPLDDGTGARAWEHALDYLSRFVTGGSGAPVVEQVIKPYDRRRGADHEQLRDVLAALDDGRPVAFYGWWPTEGAADTTEILGVDAMEVPPPDRKRAGLADGHTVVIVGYGCHDAFPGGGYVIVRNGWSGWGDEGDGYMPFTYLRTYATELWAARPAAGGSTREPASGGPATERQAGGGPRLPAVAPRDAADVAIDRHARCRDQRASLTPLFFSEDLIELARARAICSTCPVRVPCLDRALARHEPCGVWGGEIVVDGRVVAEKRGRGRPPKVPRARLVVDEITGVPIVA
ncbi:MAG: WhiB family transcriptional regulator [Ilumatobacteraceae bacterium]